MRDAPPGPEAKRLPGSRHFRCAPRRSPNATPRAGRIDYHTDPVANGVGRAARVRAALADGWDMKQAHLQRLRDQEHALQRVAHCVGDDTMRKQAEDFAPHYYHRSRARVQSLMGDLLLAEERERKRLARDLHEGLSQIIALAQLKLSALRASKSAAIDGPLVEIQELMEHADRAARSISFELSPLVLHDLGLEPALRWLTENTHERYGIVVDLKHDGQVIPTDETTRVILFRAIRELVINAAKHAGVQLVRVHLEFRVGRLEAVVSDDGIGIDPDTALSEGFGLLSVRERLAHIGGQMTIDSMCGKGTTVRLSAPLGADKPNDSRTELR